MRKTICSLYGLQKNVNWAIYTSAAYIRREMHTCISGAWLSSQATGPIFFFACFIAYACHFYTGEWTGAKRSLGYNNKQVQEPFKA